MPWDDQEFSTRMLTEHLDDRHDMASRRGSLIDRHVAWLSTLAPDGHRVLDLGCGPGLYLERFGRAGWDGIGVDVSPAAIGHATRRASVLGIGCTYVQGDLRSTRVPGPFDLVLCVFGELNTFPVEDVRDVLDIASGAVSRGGRIVIEVSTRAGVAGKAGRPVSWYTAAGGLFADGPHVVLREGGWFEDEQATVERWWVMDEFTTRPRMFGSTTWFHYQLAEAIHEAGFVIDGRFGELTGAAASGEGDFETLVLRRA